MHDAGRSSGTSAGAGTGAGGGQAGGVATTQSGSGGAAGALSASGGHAGASGGASTAGTQASAGRDAGAVRADAGNAAGSGGSLVIQTRVCPNLTDPYASSPVCNDVKDCTTSMTRNDGVLVCALAPPPTVGGIMPRQCLPTSCPAGQICRSMGLGLECLTPCTQAAAPLCDTGRCAPSDPFADVRGCAAILCDASPGFSCGPVSDCMPDAAGRDAVGCLRKSCMRNEDCPCGTCVKGRCYESPFHCFWQLFAP